MSSFSSFLILEGLYLSFNLEGCFYWVHNNVVAVIFFQGLKYTILTFTVAAEKFDFI